MYLKIAVMNNSGNVGKSMVCDTLLYPRIKGADKIKIETINSDGTEDETIAAKDIKKVFELIDSSDVAIIDVGASNIENFMSNLKRLEGAHDEIDFFFIPTTPKPKQQLDTISTVNDLLDLGVEPEKIRLIFNFYDSDYPINEQFSVIFENEIFKILKLKDMKNIFTISDNPVFDMLGELSISFTEIAAENKDYKALIRATKDLDKRAELSHQRSAYRLAKGFVKELDLTFTRINSSCNLTSTEKV